MMILFGIIKNTDLRFILIGMDISYTEPDKGNGADTGVPQPPSGKNAVADIHSHAAYDPLYDNDNFSQTDKDDNDRKGIDGYVATPAGILKKYDHISHTVTVISRKIPFDPKHPNRPE